MSKRVEETSIIKVLLWCNYRVMTPQNCGRRFAVIIVEATSQYFTSSGSVRDDEGSSTTIRELIITITYNCQVLVMS